MKMVRSRDRVHKTRFIGDPRSQLGAAVLIGALYAVYGLWSVAHDTYLHDEGLLTEVFAGWTTQHFLPFIFFQKSRPAASLFYMGSASVGLDAFFALHVLVMAAVPPLLFAVARSLGFKRPLLPAILVALSDLHRGRTIGRHQRRRHRGIRCILVPLRRRQA